MSAFGNFVVKHRTPILVISLLLLIPALLGYVNTRVNYDILYYLPEDIETMQGQQILLQDFGKGAYALFAAEGMTDPQVSRLKSQLEQVDHVAQVIWFDTLADPTIPQEILPDKIYSAYHTDDATLMAIFFDTSTSADETMDAIGEIREIAGAQCFLSSMSAIVTDTRNLVNQELFMYVLIAVALSALVLALTMDSWMAPVLFLLNIGVAILYNLGTNWIQGEISFITMSLAAVLQLGVTMDYSIFLWNSYQEQKRLCPDKEAAMAKAVSATITSVAGSSLTTVAGFIALCFMTFTLGLDLGVVMAKGVVLGVICCVTLLPGLILLCDKPIRATSHKPLALKSDRLAGFLIRHNKVLAVIMLLLWIPAIYGNNHVNVYYDLTASLPEYLPSIQANQKVEENFHMSTIHLALVEDSLSTRETKQMLSEMEQVDGVKLAMGEESLIGSAIPKEFLPDSLTGILESGGRRLILICSQYPVASDEVNAQIDQLNAIMKRFDPNGMLIGEAPCTRDLIQITDRDFQVVSLVSICAIFLLILLVLRSAVLPVLLVLVIELAIYINMSISFFTGATLPFIASVVIGTIQLGATVDYAILMTNRYQQERLRGKDKTVAATAALTASMPSIVTSALGFFAATIGVGLYSDVDLIGALCMLMARGALISMVVVLLLLPSLYLIFDRPIMKLSWGKKRPQNQQLEV